MKKRSTTVKVVLLFYGMMHQWAYFTSSKSAS